MNAASDRSPQPLEITLIAAIDADGVIGADGGMPWHVPDDLRWFKQQTLHKPILMGRRTFEAVGRALPRRRNLVLSHNSSLAVGAGRRVASVDEAIEIARQDDAGELMVIGGAQIYALALPRATCLLLTRIEARYEGDTWFPEVDWRAWSLESEQFVAATSEVPAHRFMTWRRRSD